MAVVIPFILAAAEVGTMASVLTTVAFAVTGVSDKINKAAESVFGKDLVRVANIAGAAYGAFNGGFSIGDGAGMSTAAADSALNAFDATQAGAGMSEVAAESALNAFDATQTASEMGGNVVENLADVTSAVDPRYVSETALNGGSQAPTFQPAVETAPQTVSLDPSAGSTGNGATANITPNASDYAMGGPSTGVYGVSKNVSDAGGSFFDSLKKMVTNKDGTISNGALQAGGNIIQGAFGGYSAAKAREQAQANYDAQVARQARLANLGTGAWKQTQ